MPRITAPVPAVALDPFIGPFDPKLMTVTTITVTAASTAQFMTMKPIVRPKTVSTAYFRVGAQSGNMYVRLWSSDGTTLSRIATTGSFAVPAIGSRSQALTASVTLMPGTSYYCDVWADNITATFGGIAIAAFIGSVRPAGDIAAADPTATSHLLSALGGNAKGFVITFE